MLEHVRKTIADDEIVRRQDPALLPPRALITNPVVRSIAIRGSKSDQSDYALAALEPADEVEKVEKKKKRPPRRSRRRGMGMEEMGYGMEDMVTDFIMELNQNPKRYLSVQTN